MSLFASCDVTPNFFMITQLLAQARKVCVWCKMTETCGLKVEAFMLQESPTKAWVVEVVHEYDENDNLKRQ